MLRSATVSFSIVVLALGGCPGHDDEPLDDDSGAGDDDADGDDSDVMDDDSADDDDSAADPDPYVQPEVWVTPLDLQSGERATIHYEGEFATEPALNIRYGFDGFNQLEGIDEYLEYFHYGNMDYFLEAPMTPVAGGHEVEIEIPATARALQFVFYTDDGETRAWDDGSGWGYHRGLVFPYIGPVLTWNDATAPHEGVVVSYETSTPCLGTVEWGLSPALGHTLVGDERARLHHAVLTGLPEDSDIHYRVRDSLGQVSETFRFHTPAATTDTFTFTVLGDAQDNGEGTRRWADVAAEVATAHPQTGFVLFAGDLPTDEVFTDWWTFFDRGRALFASTVVMPAIGNHDTPTDQHDPDASRFLTRFDLPTSTGGDGVYRFEYGTATVLTLNSEFPDDFRADGAQGVWAAAQIDQIAAAGDAEWVFAQWHTPPYNVGDRFDIVEQAHVREVTAHFDGVMDWVFAGHEHLYQRMHPLRWDSTIAPSGSYGPGADDGVGYLVVPPAGAEPRGGIREPDSPAAWLRELVAYPEFDPQDTSVATENGFVMVSIAGPSITIETWCMGTDVTPLSAYVCDEVGYTR